MISLGFPLPLALCLGVVIICATHSAAAQPSEDRTLRLFVDQNDSRASDDNGGSRDAPFRTIQAALNSAAGSLARRGFVRVQVGPGTYRESLTISGLAHNTSRLTVEARVSGKTVISGSDVLDGWRNANGMLIREWPYDWGEVPNPQGWPVLEPIVRRREMVIINGTVLEQTIDLTPLSKPGTFIVHNGMVAVYPPSHIDPQFAVLEVAVRPVLLKSQGPANNLTLRGLVFEHANTGAGYGANAAVVLTGSNIILEHCKFNWSNWVGLSIANADHVTITNCTADHNGENGISMWRVSQLRAVDLSASNNNWRGAAGGFVGWDADAFKALSLHDAIFDTFHAVNNQAGGMWLDTDNADITIHNAIVNHNSTNGFFFEKSQGPIVVRNSTIARNHQSGIQGSYSTNVSLVDDLICGNESTQLRIAGKDGTQNIVDHWSGQHYQLSSTRWTIIDSRIIATSGDQQLLSTYLVNSWPEFVDTLTSAHNLWAGKSPVSLSVHNQSTHNDQVGFAVNGPIGRSRFAGPLPGACPK